MKNLRNQEGMVLVSSLLLLVSMTIMGLTVVMNSTVEEQISGNDRVAKLTLINSDGGIEASQAWLTDVWTQSGGLAPELNVDDAPDPKTVQDPLDANNKGNITIVMSTGSFNANIVSLSPAKTLTGDNVPAQFSSMTRTPVENPNNYSITKSSPYGGDDSNVKTFYLASLSTGQGPRNSSRTILSELRYIGESQQ